LRSDAGQNLRIHVYSEDLMTKTETELILNEKKTKQEELITGNI